MRGTLYVNKNNEIMFLLGRWLVPTDGIVILAHVNLSDSEICRIKQTGSLRVYFVNQNNTYELITTHAPHVSELVANIDINDIGGLSNDRS